jgi:hypothetical protein
MGDALQPGVNLLAFIRRQDPTRSAGGNGRRQSGRPSRNNFGPRLRVQIPTHRTINIIFVVGSVKPRKQGIHESPVIVRIRRVAELFDEHRAKSEGRINIRLPAGGCVGSFVVIDMRRVNHPVAARSIHHRAHSHKIISVLLSADDADVLGIGAAGKSTAGAGGGAPDRVQQGLKTGSRERVPGLRRSSAVVSRGHGAAVKPDGPGVGERLIEQIEQHGGIIGVARRHALPKDRAVAVRHGILLGGRSDGSISGPLKVKVTINVVGFAKAYDGIDRSLIVGGRTP